MAGKRMTEGMCRDPLAEPGPFRSGPQGLAKIVFVEMTAPRHILLRYERQVFCREKELPDPLGGSALPFGG
ncbi:MAG: hypothetical protein ACI97B_002702 [Verrucomicrobiales bacterium]|jgi:hypothetical protein